MEGRLAVSSATDTLEAAIINHFFRGSTQSSPASIYLGLYTVTPNEAGSGGSEVVGGSYARQLVTFSAPDASGVSYNTAAIEFAGMPAVTVISGGLYTHVSAGSLFSIAPFSLPRTVAAGKTFVVAIGDVVLQVN